MSYYLYDFVTVASDNGAYILADKSGGSYYLPEQISSALNGKTLSMGEIVHLSAEKPLEMTERAGTNSIICHGAVHVSLQGSLLETGRTAELLVCHTAYNSVLLTDVQSGTDYVIFTSYVAEGYHTPEADWSTVTEGSFVRFLLFGNIPVMPAPRKRISFRIRRKSKKTPAVRSFLNGTYGAISGASMNSSPSSGMTS